MIDRNPILYFRPNRNQNQNAVIETESKPKVQEDLNSENISQNQNYALCLKFMVFGVTKETRWNVCFDKNQNQSLVEFELDPPKTGSILPKSIKICDNLLQ